MVNFFYILILSCFFANFNNLNLKSNNKNIAPENLKENNNSSHIVLDLKKFIVGLVEKLEENDKDTDTSKIFEMEAEGYENIYQWLHNLVY